MDLKCWNKTLLKFVYQILRYKLSMFEKNKPIFLHLERDVGEIQLCGFTVFYVHIVTP